MEFKLPELGEGVHEGELVKWRVKEGDNVKDDQVLCEVMTDKATMEIPSPFVGKIQSLMVKEGGTVKVGQSMLSYEGSGASAGASASYSQAKAPASAPSTGNGSKNEKTQAPAMSASSQNLSPDTRVLAAPLTRKLARERGVDLAKVQASGPHGRVMKEDLERFVQGGSATQTTVRTPSRATHPAGGETRVVFKGLRKKISEKMHISKSTAAHFTYVEEADCTALVKLRNAAKEIAAADGVKLSYLPFVMKAMVSALRQFPILNSTLDVEKGEIVLKHYYNIGLSVQTEDGLTAPVIHDVEHKSILEIAREIQDKVNRARSGKLTLADFENSTITLTNAGSIGGLFATPIINFPEVAILGFNKIARKPIAKMIGGREKIVVRDWTYFSISLDHRIVDGAIAAEFMKRFISYIENPSLLILESF